MAAQIKRAKSDFANNQLFRIYHDMDKYTSILSDNRRTWMQRWFVYSHAIVFKHMQQRGLARIIQTKKKNFRIFVV